ncbi:MAG: extracellular solute-binding protein [Chloroflexi bacterium]|nr:extracellular solute-binding protein [Chloroflexota bacterium]
MYSLRRSRLAVLFAIIVVAAVLAACVAPRLAPAGVRPPEAGAPAEKKVKVVYWAHNFEPRVTLDQKYIAEFMEQNPNIEVEYEVIPSDFDAKLRTALAAGTGPDLFAQWNGDIGTFYAQDAIVPVNAEALGFGSQKELMDLYVSPDNTLQGAMFDGKLYGIPNEVSIYACYVNKKLFEEAGLDADAHFPETWEEMVDVATKLTKRDADDKLVQQGFDFDYGASVWMFLQWGAMVRQLGGSELEVTTPEAEKVMQYWVDWSNTWKLGGPAYWTGQVDDFNAGRVAIKCAMGSWAKPLVEEAGIDYTLKKVPVWENAVNKNHFDIYAYFHMVNSKSAPEVQVAAWKLAWYLDSHPIDYMVNTGLLQPQKVLAESQEFKDILYMDLFLDEMSVSMYSPRVERFTEIADVLARARDRSIVEGMAIPESLATAQEEIDAILAESESK